MSVHRQTGAGTELCAADIIFNKINVKTCILAEHIIKVAYYGTVDGNVNLTGSLVNRRVDEHVCERRYHHSRRVENALEKRSQLSMILRVVSYRESEVTFVID